MEKYTNVNKRTIDRWVDEGWEWSIPLSHEEFLAAKGGELSLKLTPTKDMPRAWFPEALQGLRILGLCCGGGQQGPVFAAHGMDVTILDNSPRQLDREREVAAREGYEITLVEADVTEPLPFADESFDIIFNPVSLVYVEDLYPVFRECSRVLKKGGLMIAGLDNGVNFITDEEEREIKNAFPFNPLKNPALYEEMMAEDMGVQFSHTLEENVAGQLRAGFTLLDLYDDTNGTGRLEELKIPTFFATKCVKN
jgi:SAM-dependent methyltransferase